MSAERDASDAIIRDYAETTVAVADIKIAVRAQKTGKHLDFMRRAMAPCDSLNIERLSQAALWRRRRDLRVSGRNPLRGRRAGIDANRRRRLSGGATTSMIRDDQAAEIQSVFCRDRWLHMCLRRENEIKTVRIILTGKLNGLVGGYRSGKG